MTHIAQKMHMVIKSSKSKYTAQCEIDDLIQCGNIGLMDAMNRYDVNHPSKANFNTYAHWRIRKEIQGFMRKSCQIVRIPAAKQNNKDLWKSIVPLDFELQDWLTHKNYKKYGVKDKGELKAKLRNFYVYDLPWIIQNQKVKDQFTVDYEFAYDLLCDRFGIGDREKLKAPELQEKYGINP